MIGGEIQESIGEGIGDRRGVGLVPGLRGRHQLKRICLGVQLVSSLDDRRGGLAPQSGPGEPGFGTLLPQSGKRSCAHESQSAQMVDVTSGAPRLVHAFHRDGGLSPRGRTPAYLFSLAPAQSAGRTTVMAGTNDGRVVDGQNRSATALGAASSDGNSMSIRLIRGSFFCPDQGPENPSAPWGKSTAA